MINGGEEEGGEEGHEEGGEEVDEEGGEEEVIQTFRPNAPPQLAGTRRGRSWPESGPALYFSAARPG